MPFEMYAFNTRGLRDLAADCLDLEGRLKVMPASFYANVKREERAWFANRYGFYSLPTVELADWLRELIAGRSAIEIGSGNGVLAQYLGIPATDSRVQDEPGIRAYYQLMRQATVDYGPNVERIEALDAVKKYKPEVVIGCWITHRYNARDPDREGNALGPDLPAILKVCKQLVLIGNELVHAKNPLWRRPHAVQYPPWLYARSFNYGREFIAIWDGEGGA